MTKITITPDELAKSAVKYRKELLTMPIIALERTLEHMSLRLGVQYKERVGQVGNSAEFGPYDPSRKGNTTSIAGRELEVFLGSVIEEFDPNDVVSSVYGSLALSGKSLGSTPISKVVLAAVIKNLSKKLNMAVFSAKRNSSGTTSMDLFDGFDTITEKEITAGNIAVAKNNLFEVGVTIDKTNAVDVLKSIYRKASDELREEETLLYVPQSILDAYNDDYQATVGAVPYNQSFDKVFVEGSGGRCRIVPLASKKGTKFLQLTSKSNMLVGMGNGNDHENISVDRFAPFTVTLSAAILFGTQFESIAPERLLIAKLNA